MILEMHAQIAFWLMLVSLMLFSVFAVPAYLNLKEGEFDESNVATIFTAFTFCIGIMFNP